MRGKPTIRDSEAFLEQLRREKEDDTRTNADLPNVTLREGMTIAVEPIINLGSKYCKTLRDGWTVITKDGNLSAQWEHTVLVTENGFEILTDRGD